MTDIVARPTAEVRGDVRTESDKSISHRAFLLAALAEGTSVIHNPLDALDVRATMRVARRLGATVRKRADTRVVEGGGPDGIRSMRGTVNCANSGTLLRLLCGVVAAAGVPCTLTGDASLRQRPMERIALPLREMGARITCRDGRPPVRIHRGERLVGIDHVSRVASAQVKSALLLAGLAADGATSVTEPAPSRDHTERMLPIFGCDVRVDGRTVSVTGGQTPKGANVRVPADISSAAFLLTAAVTARKGEVVLREVSVNPTRAGIVEIYRRMGADIRVENPRTLSGEPVADLRAGPSALRGIEIPPELVPSAIDEFPAIFVAAALAEGATVLRRAAELRVKESDRIAAMAAGLAAAGADVAELPDGISIRGNPRGLRGGRADSRGDHRVAMAMAIAGLRSQDGIAVTDCDNVRTSFPGFVAQCRAVGCDIAESPWGRESGRQESRRGTRRQDTGKAT